MIQSLGCLKIHGQGRDMEWMDEEKGEGGADGGAHVCDDTLDVETEPSEERLKTRLKNQQQSHVMR